MPRYLPSTKHSLDNEFLNELSYDIYSRIADFGKVFVVAWDFTISTEVFRLLREDWTNAYWRQKEKQKSKLCQVFNCLKQLFF